MTDTFVLSGLVVGTILLLLYLLVRASSKSAPDASEGFRAFLSALGAATATKICSLALWDERLNDLQDSERVYIFLGGLAAIWVCIESILRVFVRAFATSRVQQLKRTKTRSEG